MEAAIKTKRIWSAERKGGIHAVQQELDAMNNGDDSTETVNALKAPANGGKGFRGTGRCWYCGNTGHMRPDCEDFKQARKYFAGMWGLQLDERGRVKGFKKGKNGGEKANGVNNVQEQGN
jgi:hypothetical protein